jgi:hypothetical protein
LPLMRSSIISRYCLLLGNPYRNSETMCLRIPPMLL